MKAPGNMSERNKGTLIGLAFFLAICFSVYGIGGWVTASSVGSWYQTLEKPSFNPPDWIFTPVWTVLFIFMAVAGWRVWHAASEDQRNRAMLLFGVQLALNLAWSCLFFGLQLIGLALVDIVLLLAAIIATTVRFRQIDRLSGLLFVPYVLWVMFAAVLNAALFVLNRPSEADCRGCKRAGEPFCGSTRQTDVGRLNAAPTNPGKDTHPWLYQPAHASARYRPPSPLPFSPLPETPRSQPRRRRRRCSSTTSSMST